MDNSPVKVFSLLVGANYRLDDTFSMRRAEVGYLFPRNYVFYNVGLQHLYSTSVSMPNTFGPSFSLGYGRWITPRLAVQGSIGYSTGNSHLFKNRTLVETSKSRYDLDYRTQYLFGRGEVVYNVYSTITNRSLIDKDFSFNLVGGLELGSMRRYQPVEPKILEKVYVAPTVGLQAKYHHNEDFALFVEPRASFINFDQGGMVNNDVRYNLSAGVEMSFDNDNYRHYSVDGEEFVPFYSISAMGGLTSAAHGFNVVDKSHTDGSFGLAFEYQPYERFGFRVLGDYSSYGFNNLTRSLVTSNGATKNHYGVWNKSYSTINLGAHFKVDLNSLLFGYNKSRRWSSALYVGPVLSKVHDFETSLSSNEFLPDGSVVKSLESGSKNIHLGFYGGLNTQYNIDSHWGVFGEAGVRLYGNEFLPENNLDNSPVKVLNYQVGVSYKF